ncbi:MAG: VOC family protein [Pseudomonadota bacterium]|nr:VOC family protein [Pseudomonadota bacterium]
MAFGDNWELNHVGLMISDRNATLRHFQSIGVGVSVGPQPLLPHEPGHGSLTLYRTLEGDPMTNTYPTGGAHNFRDGECQIGDCQLECYPMRPGPGSFISEYLAKQGPGINHICFNTPDIEKDSQVFLDLGCELTFDARVNGKTVENYLDTRKHGDLMISLRPPPTDWERAWKANNQAHPLVPQWKFLGLGVAVADLDATVAYYATMGFEAVSDPMTDTILGTRRQGVQVGPLTFEFSEALSDNSVVADSLSKRGDGVNDLGFGVTDLDAETQRLEAKGVTTLRRSNDNQVTYLDTRAEGNIMLRLAQGG